MRESELTVRPPHATEIVAHPRAAGTEIVWDGRGSLRCGGAIEKWRETHEGKPDAVRWGRGGSMAE